MELVKTHTTHLLLLTRVFWLLFTLWGETINHKFITCYISLQLKAFQNSKKKKKKKRSQKNPESGDLSISEPDTGSKSEPLSLSLTPDEGAGAADTYGENVSQDTSPIPFDDIQNYSLQDTIGLQYDSTSRLSTSLPVVSVYDWLSLHYPPSEPILYLW